MKDHIDDNDLIYSRHVIENRKKIIEDLNRPSYDHFKTFNFILTILALPVIFVFVVALVALILKHCEFIDSEGKIAGVFIAIASVPCFILWLVVRKKK